MGRVQLDTLTPDQAQPTAGAKELVAPLLGEEDFVPFGDYPEFGPIDSPYWARPQYRYVVSPHEGIPGRMLEAIGNGTHSRYELTEGPDRFHGSDADESVFGFGAYDWLRGGGGRDLLNGGGGGDTLEGDGGNDLLVGGEGQDTLAGGEGADRLFGDEGNDWIYGGGGNDYVDGGDGNDEYLVGEGGVTVDLAAGVAWGPMEGRDRLANIENVFGGGGNDRLMGNDLDNVLHGGAGDDTLMGGDGHDVLWGEVGSDHDALYGGRGNDRLNFGALMFGGSDADTFGIATSGYHVIGDFEPGVDFLDFRLYSSLFPTGTTASDFLAAAADTPDGALFRFTFETDPGSFELVTFFLQNVAIADLSARDFLI